MMKKNLNIGIIVSFLIFITSGNVFAQLNGQSSLNENTNFGKAYNQFISAPVKSYDFSPCISSFNTIAAETSSKKTKTSARFFLLLSYFCSTNFDKAYNEIKTIYTRKLYPENKTTTVLLPKVMNEYEVGHSSFQRLLINNSLIKVIMPGENVSDLVGIEKTIKIFDTQKELSLMQPTTVYKNAREKINKLEKETTTDKQKKIMDMMKKNVDMMKMPSTRNFYKMTDVLSILIEDSSFNGMRNSITKTIGLSICAQNLRQIGIAFHLYLLDHNDYFPPLTVKDRVPNGTPDQAGKGWIQLLEPYLGLKNVIVKAGGWDNGYIPLVPSLFDCPTRQHSWTMYATGEYGYNDYVSRGGPTPGWPFYKWCKFSYVPKPDIQVVVAESLYGSRLYGNHQFVAPHGHIQVDGNSSVDLQKTSTSLGNVLYADGHVEAHPFSWAISWPYGYLKGGNDPWDTMTK
ncbi:MAG: DUF1559 domain-containing protein [Candidatus Omnitrophica bacterium]|nr:DUF1559 domain-containing protein [Candidatus Omnitrophota bacterium]